MKNARIAMVALNGLSSFVDQLKQHLPISSCITIFKATVGIAAGIALQLERFALCMIAKQV